ncbi:MAG: amino acid ABC transporter permease [Deltaproteobacteria bacterium]|nr:amino acid ABC transporter permease [Deltaproteobacteria bacterium]MBT7716493.1 amino acid ABC transporter permease [Deltaproteobacteria bacterium]
MDSQATPKTELLNFIPSPSRPPVVITHGFTGWLKKHLFGGFWNTLLTIAVFTLLYLLLKPFLEWSLVKAVWTASSRRECLSISPDGACWAAVIRWSNNLIYGRYPDPLQWRINLGIGIGIIWLLPLALKKIKHKIVIGLMAVVFYPFLASYLFLGGDRGRLHYVIASVALAYLFMLYMNIILIYLGKKQTGQYFESLIERFVPRRADLLGHLTFLLILSVLIAFMFRDFSLQDVSTDVWGGLFLTIIISGFSIVMALPIGILLALGRRSQMPVVRWFSIATIELVRSVPMITVLFMSVTMMPLFFPNTMDLNKLAQVIIAVCIFAGAYMAETVRGGLQAIPKGQFDAAKSIGLGYWYTMAFIILPQALRAMIPNIVTSFISLFKDTTLVSIIGLFDLMLMARNISIDKNWFGLHTEPLVAISVLFFIFCYTMSQYSQRLERHLTKGR